MATDSVTVSPTFNGDSVSLTTGMIVRLKPGANNNVVRAQADSTAHAQGVNGVVISGSAAPTGVVTVVCTGRETVQMDSGLTPKVGDTVYVSPTTPGKGTNAPPAVVSAIGTIADISNYVTGKTVEVDVAVSAVTPASVPSPSIVALWTGTRFYAVDYDNGSDANVGFSDVDMPTAGKVAFKTLEQLALVFPKIGNNRAVTVAVATRAGSDKQYYQKDGVTVSSLDFLVGTSGYLSVTVRATVTNATAGSVAFANDANDRLMAGGIPYTGTVGGGYTATGTPSTTLVQFGGSPGFAAEPGLLGARLRFALSSSIPNNISMVNANMTNAITMAPARAVAPVAGDVAYLEMPGVMVQLGVVGRASTASIVGFNFLTSLGSSGDLRTAFCTGEFLSTSGGTVSIGIGFTNGPSRYTSGLFLTGCSTAVDSIYSPELSRTGTTGNTLTNFVLGFVLDVGTTGMGGANFDLAQDVTLTVGSKPGILPRCRLLHNCGGAEPAMCSVIGGFQSVGDVSYEDLTAESSRGLFANNSIQFVNGGVTPVPINVDFMSALNSSIGIGPTLPNVSVSEGVGVLGCDILTVSQGLLAGTSFAVLAKVGALRDSQGSTYSYNTNLPPLLLATWPVDPDLLALGPFLICRVDATADTVFQRGVLAQADTTPHSANLIGVNLADAGQTDLLLVTSNIVPIYTTDATPTVPGPAYLSDTVPGGVTTTAPGIAVKVGTVVGNLGAFNSGQLLLVRLSLPS